MHPRRTLLALRLMQTKASAEPMKGGGASLIDKCRHP